MAFTGETSVDRPLSVLLTAQFLDGRTGSEVVLRDRAVSLLKRGHAPVVYCPRPGAMAAEIQAAGVPVAADLNAIDRPIDVIHATHHATLAATVARFPDVPVVSAHQDFVAEIDRPWPFSSVRRWLACDAAVADGLVSQGGVPAAQLRTLLNAVDLERFQAGPALPDRPGRALAFAKNSQHVEAVAAACARAGLDCDFIGPAVGLVAEDVEDLLPRYDLVFASGLSAIEALACGRAVIVCDGRGLAGYCGPAAWDAWRPLNFGLRALTRAPEADALAAEIACYDAAASAEAGRRCRAEASLARYMDDLVALYREAIEDHRADPPGPGDVGRDLAAYLQAWGGQIELRRARRRMSRPIALAPDLYEAFAAEDRLTAAIDAIDHEPIAPINVVSRTEAAVVQGWTMAGQGGHGGAGARRLLIVQQIDNPDLRYAAVLQRGVPRPDLAAHFPDLDPRHAHVAGFSETIDFAAVEPGRYRLGVALRGGGESQTRMFDRLVEVI